jgi:hypothetical protein
VQGNLRCDQLRSAAIFEERGSGPVAAGQFCCPRLTPAAPIRAFFSDLLIRVAHPVAILAAPSESSANEPRIPGKHSAQRDIAIIQNLHGHFPAPGGHVTAEPDRQRQAAPAYFSIDSERGSVLDRNVELTPMVSAPTSAAAA